MTIEELQAEILRINELNKDLEARLAGQNELLEGFKTRETEHKEQASKYQEQIMKLRDMNTDLFLRVSQPVPMVENPAPVDEPSQESTISLDDILG